MVYGTFASPLAPCCQILLSHLPSERAEKIRNMRHISLWEYTYLISTLKLEQQTEFKDLCSQALDYQTKYKSVPNHIIQELRATIEQLWETNAQKYISKK